MVKDGVVFTPEPTGTYLAGITRARVIKLLRDSGVEVVETALRHSDFENADEIFSTGDYSKVSPVIRIGERILQPGPIYRGRPRALLAVRPRIDGLAASILLGMIFSENR